MSAIHAVTVPKWGLATEDAQVVRWCVSLGASINAGDELAELETGKAVNSVVADDSGVLRRILLEPGATAAVGDLLGIIAEAHVADSAIDAFVQSHRAGRASHGP